MGRHRVVLVMDSARQRALVRMGLELSGRFEVVGSVVDSRDVASILSSAKPDIALVDFSTAADGGLGLVPVVADSSPGTVVVMFEALLARDAIMAGGLARDRTVRPARIATLLDDVLAGEVASVA